MPKLSRRDIDASAGTYSQAISSSVLLVRNGRCELGQSSIDLPSLDEQLRKYLEFVYRFCSLDFGSAHWTLA
jgi:hypothetical protein